MSFDDVSESGLQRAGLQDIQGPADHPTDDFGFALIVRLTVLGPSC